MGAARWCGRGCRWRPALPTGPPTGKEHAMAPLRILIADDHPLFRDGMHGLLDAVPDMEVVGEAKTGDEAVALAASLRPDVILMDIKMPGVNGIAATREILAAHPHIGILIVTMFEDDDSVFAAMRAGAQQSRDRRSTDAERQDGAKPRVEHLRQAAGRGSRAGSHSRPPGRPRRRSSRRRLMRPASTAGGAWTADYRENFPA